MRFRTSPPLLFFRSELIKNERIEKFFVKFFVKLFHFLKYFKKIRPAIKTGLRKERKLLSHPLRDVRNL